MTLVQRLIVPQFTLATGTFAEGGTNTLTLPSNLRVSAKILKAATPMLGVCEATIFGMTLSQMNQLSTLGMRYKQTFGNVVTIMAGDAQGGTPVVFTGNIFEAYPDMNRSPDVGFVLQAQTLGQQKTAQAQPTSFSGAATCATIVGQLAKQMGLTLENNGVSSTLASPYLWGSPVEQVQQCADAGGFDWQADAGILAIWPRGGSRNTPNPVVVTPIDGSLINYPSYTQWGVKFQTPFNPRLRNGDQVTIKDSQLAPANRMWAVYMVDHDIDANVPGGNWLTTVQTYDLGAAQASGGGPPVPQ